MVPQTDACFLDSAQLGSSVSAFIGQYEFVICLFLGCMMDQEVTLVAGMSPGNEKKA
jgi:hypothetical protein